MISPRLLKRCAIRANIYNLMTVSRNIVKTPVNLAERQALDIRAGDTVRVTIKIVEEKITTGANKKAKSEKRSRLQKFEGLVIARKHGKEAGGTFTVRKVSSGVGVEKIFPLYSPNIEKIELVKRAKVRRSKLYYIRATTSKEMRKKMKNQVFADYAVVEPESVPLEEVETEAVAGAKSSEVSTEGKEAQEEVIAEEKAKTEEKEETKVEAPKEETPSEEEKK